MEDDTDIDYCYARLEAKALSLPIEAMSKETIDTCTECIVESNELVQKVKATHEVIKDACVLSALTNSIHESTKCINISESNFDPQTFATAVVDLISSYGGDWSILAEKSKGIFRYAPGITYIAAHKSDQPSTQVVEITERKARQTRKKLEEQKEPEKVKTVTRTDAGVSATEMICKLLRNLYKQNDKKPLCFFKFTIDPNSFSKSIENIFHLAFLARDGLVVISLDNHKLPVLTPTRERRERTDIAASNEAKMQTLVSITQSQWKDIVKVFNITKATIP